METGIELIAELIEKTLVKYPDKVSEYQSGKKGIMGLFVGEVMRASKGKADPKTTTKMLNDRLNNLTDNP